MIARLEYDAQLMRFAQLVVLHESLAIGSPCSPVKAGPASYLVLDPENWIIWRGDGTTSLLSFYQDFASYSGYKDYSELFVHEALSDPPGLIRLVMSKNVLGAASVALSLLDAPATLIDDDGDGVIDREFHG